MASSSADDSINFTATLGSVHMKVGAYVKGQIGDAMVFEVVPGEGPKFWPLVGIGVAVLVLGFFSGVSILLVFLVSAALIALGWYDLRPVEHKTASSFKVSPKGVEALGEMFRKNEIDELTVATGYEGGDSLLTKIGAALARYQAGKIEQVTASLRLRTGGRDVTLAGGLTPHSAASLLRDVREALDAQPSISRGEDLRGGLEGQPRITRGEPDRQPSIGPGDDATVTSAGPMQPGDMLLREVEYGVYQLERVTAAGYEFVITVPFKDDLTHIITFALAEADGSTLWFRKIADRGGPPVIIPESILESPGFAGR